MAPTKSDLSFDDLLRVGMERPPKAPPRPKKRPRPCRRVKKQERPKAGEDV